MSFRGAQVDFSSRRACGDGPIAISTSSTHFGMIEHLFRFLPTTAVVARGGHPRVCMAAVLTIIQTVSRPAIFRLLLKSEIIFQCLSIDST